MTWLSRLSFAQAIRWALVWPVLVVSLCVVGALIVVRERDEWAIGWNFQSAGTSECLDGAASQHNPRLVRATGDLSAPLEVGQALSRVTPVVRRSATTECGNDSDFRFLRRRRAFGTEARDYCTSRRCERYTQP
jgi:hypothetical protein